MTPRLTGQTSLFGVVFFVSKSLLGIEGQKKLAILTRKPRSHARILIYRTWPIVRINRLGRALNDGKGFSKISKPTERNGAYHLHFDFP